MIPPPTAPTPSLDTLKARLRRLNLYGLLAHPEEILAEPWPPPTHQIAPWIRLIKLHLDLIAARSGSGRSGP
jgi:hypothetical protein